MTSTTAWSLSGHSTTTVGVGTYTMWAVVHHARVTVGQAHVQIQYTSLKYSPPLALKTISFENH